MLQESDYNTKVKNLKPSFLGDSLNYISEIESSNLCDVIYSDATYVDLANSSIQLCQTALNNITSQGFTAVLFKIY